MRIAILGRTEILYETVLLLCASSHEISCILTAKEAPEYTRTASDFETLADTLNIPFARGGRAEKFVDFLVNAKADVCVSMNYVSLVPQSVIDLFPLGILNIHGGDLPRYRGNACQAWAILNGEERIGLCIHKMIGDELDSGDIIARDYLNIDHNTKVSEIWSWMECRGPSLTWEAIEKLNGDIDYILERQSKDPRDVLRCYPRKPEDGKIDWNKNPIEVLRLVNASNKPYSGAYCVFNGEKLTVWDAQLVQDDEIYCAIPGQVTKISEGCVEVACGNGKIKLKTVEFRGDLLRPDQVISSLRSRLV